MKKLSVCFLTIVLFVSCKAKPPRVEKITEDGVEVVINHVEPYSLPGVPSTLKLEEDFSIDTEKDNIVKTGLTMIESFCLDRDGNIYCMMRQSPENFIYKFDGSGKFLMSFGRKGQGPGEFDWGGDILIDEQNHVLAKDMTKEKFYAFSGEGILGGIERQGEYVFPGRWGRGHLVDCKKDFEAARKKAELPELHFHDLRHCAGTYWDRAGASLRTIQELLGHQDPRTTARYINTDEQRRKAVEAVAIRFSGPQESDGQESPVTNVGQGQHEESATVAVSRN